jgi:hypothetical protein
MQFVDAALCIAAQIELGFARQRGFEFRRDQLGKVAPHPLGHAAFGFTRHPDEQRHLENQRHGEKENEAEADAPVKASSEGSRHQRPYTRCPTPSG